MAKPRIIPRTGPGQGPLLIGVHKFGDWQEAHRILGTAGFRVPVAIRKAVKQEAQFLRRKIIENLKQGGKLASPFAPLSQGTLLSRRLRRRRSKKPLIESADMWRSIRVKVKGNDAFVGILRTARGKDGRPLANIAKVHEFGQTVAVPVTRAMLRFLHLMFRKGNKRSEQTGSSMTIREGEVLVVRIPPRPFIMPVAEKYFGNKAIAQKRMLARIAILMAGDLGHVKVSISDLGGIAVSPLPTPTPAK